MASNSLLTSSSDVAGIPSTKRKRKVVSIEKKLEICRRHEMGQSYKVSVGVSGHSLVCPLKGSFYF